MTAPFDPHSHTLDALLEFEDPRTGIRWHGVAVRSYKAFFSMRFGEFLRENFASPEQIAITFGVTARQAQNWLDGTSAPRGHVVARAFTDPRLSKSAYKHLQVVK